MTEQSHPTDKMQNVVKETHYPTRSRAISFTLHSSTRPTATRRLFLPQQAADSRDASHASTLLLLLILPATEHIAHRAEPQSSQQLVNAQAAEETVHKTSKTEAIEQASHKIQHTSKQQAHRRDDLEQRLSKQAPERIKLLLRMRHIRDLLLRVVDGRDDRGGEFLEVVGELVFLGGGFAGLLAALCLGGDAAVGVEAAEGAVAVVEEARAFFDEGLDVVDEFFFVELVAGGAVGLFDVLWLR